MNPFVDIHTHSLSGKTDCIEIKNVLYGQEGVPQSSFSVGYHPWHICNIDGWEYELQQIAERGECVAIGETGIDSASSVSVAVQELVFRKHIEIAKTLHKPLVIHCVKSFDRIGAILHHQKFTLPVLFHAYNGSPQLTKQLLRFHAYFSFGKWLFVQSPKSEKSLRGVPLSRLFLETDDADIFIEDVYGRAAELLLLPFDELKKQLFANYNCLWQIKKP